MESSEARLADWVTEMADEVVSASERRGLPVVVASGLSPSGPVHLGNLREVMTPHLVADEIRRRGIPCRHLLSWDDFDRFRRVPVGIDPAWEAHIGKPLSRVPAPSGSPYDSWADHFKAPMTAALEDLGIEVEPISQSQMYTSGRYLDQIVLALRARHTIEAILSPFRTKKVAVEVGDDGGHEADCYGAGSGMEYFPYRPYCAACGKDMTTVVAYDEAFAVAYECACGHNVTVDLRTNHDGKLVWKVDWPMRWAYEGVLFEPSGVDHQAPGSSFEVGRPIVERVFGSERPIGPMYAFVGVSGMSKMSSSRGNVPTPVDALAVMEPQVLRWLYARRRPRQSFDVGFGDDLLRLYDEWDAAIRKVATCTAGQHEVAAVARASATAAGALPVTPRPVPFRTITSIIDITADDPAQLLRVLTILDDGVGTRSLADFEPRLGCARRWVQVHLTADRRTVVRTEPDRGALASLAEVERLLLWRLVDEFDDHWSLDRLTGLLYGVPKVGLGLSMDAPADGTVKRAQREFFKLVYRLLLGPETGPRLPTLLLAIGVERARLLLTPV